VKSKADFAEKAGIPGGSSMVSQHQSGNRPISLEAGIAYAKGLKVSLLEISPRLVKMVCDLPPLLPDGDAPGTNLPQFHKSLRQYPVLSHAQAASLADDGAFPDPAESLDIEFGKDNASPDAFFLALEGDAMSPELREGDRVLIDPQARPRPGDYVLARNGKRQALLRKYRVRGVDEEGAEVFDLVPINEDHAVLRSDRNRLVLMGSVLEHRRRPRAR
jgi:SOS-response transcriptional repressor LexA